MSNRVSLAELAGADIKLRPAEAVALVSAICSQYLTGTLPGIPSRGVIRLSRDGDLAVEGPITTGDDPVRRAALLLSDLLSGFEALPEYRAGGPLRLVIARALGTIDLPPYPSLYEFRAALTRFVTEDVRDVARALFSSWERASVTRAFNAAPRAALTISDVRRARRATGMSLGYLSTVAEVPSRRLRDLEWGYMRDWPATAEGRAQVIRYARAAGLDESIVLSIAWPMIVDHADASSPPPSPSTALVAAGPQALAVTRPAPPPGGRRRWLHTAVVAAAAIIALLGAFAFGWRSSPRPPRETVQVGVSGQEIPSGTSGHDEAPPPAVGVRAVSAQTESEPVHAIAPATAAPSEGRTPAAAPPRPKRRRPPTRPEPRQERKAPLFERELFRIVIR